MRSWRILVPFSILLAYACGSNTASTKRDNIAYLYGKGSGGIRLNARVHHETAERSILYYKIPTTDVLYKSTGAGTPFRALVQLSYEVYADWSAKVVLDSASTLVQDHSQDPSEDKELIGSLDLRRIDRPTYLIRLTARDLNRETRSSVMLRVERNTNSIRQNFLPIDPRNGLPRFGDHIAPNDGPVKIRCEAYAGRSLWATRYKASDGLPSPVFTTSGNSRPPSEVDSTFIITVDPEEGTFLLDLNTPGTYHIRSDTAQAKGYTLSVLAQTYPYVGTGADMLRPLRYITSMQEYERITKSANIRAAIERFWLDSSGDRERAREAIRIYYGRVENANRHFTADVEGWRTDRGLVHIIFGIPNSIYRSDLSETWVFGEENNLLSLSFTFVKRDSPFTENDLVLQRDPSLKGAWYRNVESWRNGRVYQN